MSNRKMEKELKKSIERIKCEDRLDVIKKGLVFEKKQERFIYKLQFAIIAVTVFLCAIIEILIDAKNMVVEFEATKLVTLIASVWLIILIIRKMRK
ncbi:hypothetical protein LJC17_05085 [Acholeplasma sp. OttesenSCG-928-E16]|nr:hypothetical protein [Acholeplasma sp. OttesenSCG-928-E16]